MDTADKNLVSWMRESALPLWASRGWDTRNGGFVEELRWDGSPSDPGFKRVRVQGRQLFSFSTAALLGWHPEAADIARRGFEFIQSRCQAGGKWVRRLRTDGSVLDQEADLYDIAFIALGLSTYHRLTRESGPLRLLEATLAQVKSLLTLPSGKGYHQSPGDKGTIRQNPHMHWFEAMLYSFEATGDPRYLEEAKLVHQLFQDHFLDSDSGALREVFDGKWDPVLEEGKVLVEPGHHYEWSWLLWKAGPVMSVDPRFAKLMLDFADRFGVERSTGLVYDQVSDKGELTQSTHRLWVQTEALKAWLVRDGLGEKERLEGIRRIESNLLRYYLDREPPGSWGDRLDPGGILRKGPVPASSMYHIMVAVTELSAWRSGKSPSL